MAMGWSVGNRYKGFLPGFRSSDATDQTSSVLPVLSVEKVGHGGEATNPLQRRTVENDTAVTVAGFGI